MDARKYVSKYIKPDSVRDGPIRTHILTVYEEERYGRLQLELENGSQFPLNETNTSILIKAWGNNTDDWIGREAEFELATWWDRREDPPVEKETVRARAAPEAPNGSTPPKPLPSSLVATAPKNDMDDEIPF